MARHSRRLTAAATSHEGDTLAQLAEKLGFIGDEWRHWLRAGPHTSGGITLVGGRVVALDELREVDELSAGQSFEVPNTIAMLWYGDLGRVGQAAVGWRREKRYAERLGFHVEAYAHSSTRSAAENQEAALQRLRLSEAGQLHGLSVAGHGNPYSFGNSTRKTGGVDYQDASWALRYRLPLVVMHVCDGDWSRHEQGWDRRGARDLSSEAKNRVFFGVKGTFYPDVSAPFPEFVYQTNAKHLWELLKPGEQGTNG
jgi:hypothetical protein